MNAIDGTDRQIKKDTTPPPSLLTVVLDTNPHAWAELSDTLPISAFLPNLLVFINAHLASGTENEVAVIASHLNRAEWLYPTPHVTSSPPGTNGSIATASVPGNPNKYRQFALVEASIISNITRLLDSLSESAVASTTSTLIGGALSLALSYIAKSEIRHSPVDLTSNGSDNPLSALADTEAQSQRLSLTSRILVVSVSGDLANQYIPVMNAIFAAQRKRIPIDVLKLAGDTVLLQQACDATNGVYIKPEHPGGILQYLMMGFLPDQTARKWLNMPGAEAVDFRAACFCHRKVVDMGYVCSVCLSIFCEPNLPDNLCLTCGSYLSLAAAQTGPPALIPRKRKKKKKVGGTGTDSVTPGGNTPAGSGTPMHA
ncbi:RNA polymerase II transcription factor B subunit 4 [Delitschia confertaspora ATCC 74209]|uniref:General transcription and DNA repair factor IIH subunit TFB4 n=1 Tax=Delitschia confertaspora ATCC 74209 TaxID=1513339 RepID=A0A9P4JPR6_9PLEO|nr:RNA polymerase II transcription factor B subunit 4 [Delitschia confertaspora ATCC 74209]